MSNLPPALFTVFISLLCTSLRLHLGSHTVLFLSASNVVLSCRPPPPSPRDHAFILSFKQGEAKPQKQQTEISILPISGFGLGEIHQKLHNSPEKKKKTTVFFISFDLFPLVDYIFLALFGEFVDYNTHHSRKLKWSLLIVISQLAAVSSRSGFLCTGSVPQRSKSQPFHLLHRVH